MAVSCPIVAVGAVVWRGPEQLLLIRRGHPPRQGEWSIPGGRVEPGETVRAALQREVGEETGLGISVEALIDVVDFIEGDQDGSVRAHYVLIDFSAHWRQGAAKAGGDAAKCSWFSPEAALARVCWEETRRIIRLSAQRMWGLSV